jgi:DNA-binding response OmpR family regulator
VIGDGDVFRYNHAMRILIVEDDPKVASFVARGLREENFAVDCCASGDNAAWHLRTAAYDLVILDLMLPGKDGLTVCREMRARSLNMPVLMLTARAKLSERIQGLSEGADDYLTKPFSFEELLARVKALLRRSRDFQSPDLACADLRLDPFRRKVFRAGEEIFLTGKEYAILEYLLRNRGRVVSATAIIEHAWDMNYDGDRNIVNVYISHLREKIDRRHDVKIIRTLRGHGFTVDGHE